jgi:hypothetical protein
MFHCFIARQNFYSYIFCFIILDQGQWKERGIWVCTLEVLGAQNWGQKWGFLKGRGTKGKSMRKFRDELGVLWGVSLGLKITLNWGLFEDI